MAQNKNFQEREINAQEKKSAVATASRFAKKAAKFTIAAASLGAIAYFGYRFIKGKSEENSVEF